MRTLKHIAAIPDSGVEVVLEGGLTRLFFDFTDPEPREGDDQYPADIKACESIDVHGRTKADIVSAIINDRYTPDANQALSANRELAKDPESGISEAKREEYLAEYAAYQAWRSHAKEVASKAVEIIESL